VELAASKSRAPKELNISGKRWNEEGYEGLISKYSGGRPAQLT